MYMKKLLQWSINNLPFIGTLVLLALIPLYPKLPLIGIIRTWVYIRLEDFITAFFIGTFILLTLLKRGTLMKTPLTVPVGLYWFVGIISSIYSVLFIGPKLTGYFPHLVAFHFIRRIEYMMLFFVAFAAVLKRPDRLKWIIGVLSVTAIAIFIYGLGQKLWGFPAFLTMNEEFAKGIPLRLPPTARIPSTFGGHYDLAAYLVLIIPIFGSLVFGVKKWWFKLAFLGIATSSYILLLLTASRISFGVYVVAICAMLLWQKKYLLILPVLIASFVLLNYVDVASERFYKTLRVSDVIVDLSTGQPIGTLESLEGGTAVVETQERPDVESLPKGSGFIGVPTQQQPGGAQTAQNIEFQSSELATGSGDIATVSGSFLIQKALVYDISITTRFQGQWPRAIAAFKRNILLGSGFSTLSVAADGDYFRMLGETGILGTITFLGIFVVAFWMYIKGKDKLQPLEKSFVIGLFAGLVGLFFNAILIDVFEASKVAFSLWMLMGIGIALLATKVERPAYGTILWKLFTHRISLAIYLVFLSFGLYWKATSLYFIGDDFTWLRWAAENKSVKLVQYFTDSEGFFYRPIPKIWYFFLYSVFWLKPFAYHLMSLALYAGIVVGLYVIGLMSGIRRWLIWIVAALFASLAVHHEVVFWISSQSHLLAAFWFVVSLIAWMKAMNTKGIWKAAWYCGAILSLAISMFSWDTMMLVPLAFPLLALTRYKKRNPWVFLPVILIPIYWYMRTYAGAVPAEGDYGYKAQTFLVNTIANGVGYFLGTFTGPDLFERWAYLRVGLRDSLQTITLGIFGVLTLIALILFASRKNIQRFVSDGAWVFVWLIIAVITFAAFAGLGGLTERYTLVPSIFILLALASFLELCIKSKSAVFAAVIFIAALFGWNVREINRVSQHWEVASTVSEKTLVNFRNEYFPLTQDKTFIFINTPIRYGRAWIFPLGMDDPLWHMFKFNTYTYKVSYADNPEQAYEKAVQIGGPFAILGFENYVLKKIQREVLSQ